VWTYCEPCPASAPVRSSDLERILPTSSDWYPFNGSPDDENGRCLRDARRNISRLQRRTVREWIELALYLQVLIERFEKLSPDGDTEIPDCRSVNDICLLIAEFASDDVRWDYIFDLIERLMLTHPRRLEVQLVAGVSMRLYRAATRKEPPASLEEAVPSEVAEGLHIYALAGLTGPSGDMSLESMSTVQPVSIWLSKEDDHDSVEAAVVDLVSEAGLEIFEQGSPEIGSWFRRSAARPQKGKTRAEVERLLSERAAEIEQAISLRVTGKAQAEVDSAQGDTVAKLITSVENTPQALIQTGSILLVKVDGVLVVRNLTPQEMVHLRRNPALLKQPQEILTELQNEIDTSSTRNSAQVSGGSSDVALPGGQWPNAGQ
jgi:hypothetical protein